MKATVTKTVLAVCIVVMTTLLFKACSIFEPYDEIYYHSVKGEGYVYYQGKPMPDVTVVVSNTFESKGWMTTITPIREHFTTDASGHFYVRFIRRTKHEDVIGYGISASNDTLASRNRVTVFPKDIRKLKTTFQIDTLILKKHFVNENNTN